MLDIEKIFLCDHIEEGQFGKIDIIGFNPTDLINFDILPYNFTSHFVVTGKINEPLEKSILKIVLKNEKGDIIAEIPNNIDDKPIDIEAKLFIIVAFNIRIEHFGEMVVSFEVNGNEIYSETYKLIKGKSPNIWTEGGLPHAKIFEGQDTDLNFVINLLKSANKTLKIIDNYITPSDLLSLLENVNNTSVIQIITLPNSKKQFSNNLVFKKTFPNLEIKSSNDAHDRFVIINDSEYYHFGHSLKDIANKKLSRCTKITSKKETDNMQNIFSNIWEQAT